jgi:hypothetical protein
LPGIGERTLRCGGVGGHERVVDMELLRRNVDGCKYAKAREVRDNSSSVSIGMRVQCNDAHPPARLRCAVV